MDDKYPLDETWESMVARIHNPMLAPRRSGTFGTELDGSMRVGRKVFTKPPQRRKKREKPKFNNNGHGPS